MNITEEQYELAERYLAGLLSGKELTEFKKMLEENPALKDQTEKIRRVNELMFMEGLKTELPKIQKAQEQYIFRLQLKAYGKWLGGFIAVAGIIALLWNYSDTQEKQTSLSYSVENKQLVQDSFIASNNVEKKGSGQVFSSRNTTAIQTQPDTQTIETKKDQTYYQSDHLPKAITGSKIVLQDSSDKKSEVLNNEPCKEEITGSFETTATCESKSEGSIRVLSVLGGVKPYFLSLENGKYRETNFFQFLSEGDYTISIRDANGCTSKSYTVKVPVKSCGSISKDYVFSYQTTQEFVFPVLDGNDFTFQVFNSAGGLEFISNVKNGMPSSWDGYGANGQKLSIGSYSFRFINADQKILQQGTITIVD